VNKNNDNNYTFIENEDNFKTLKKKYPKKNPINIAGESSVPKVYINESVNINN
jgi:hypothetical protein